jgi:hypothetical protein
MSDNDPLRIMGPSARRGIAEAVEEGTGGVERDVEGEVEGLVELPG